MNYQTTAHFISSSELFIRQITKKEEKKQISKLGSSQCLKTLLKGACQNKPVH